MNAQHFRKHAERCRFLVITALRPEVKQQLRLWAREFDDLADTLEAREHGREYVEEDAS